MPMMRGAAMLGISRQQDCMIDEPARWLGAENMLRQREPRAIRH